MAEKKIEMKSKLIWSAAIVAVSVIGFLVVYNLVMSGAPDSSAKYSQVFAEKVKWQIETQWYWARVCERIGFITNGLAWFLGILVVVLSAAQIYTKGDEGKWLKILIAILVPLAGSIAALSAKFGFDASQKVHEQAAREYDHLYDRIRYEQLELKAAVEEYHRIHASLQKAVVKVEDAKDPDAK